ncbi:MAG: gluconeogenesis factor YvcK family protein, partial [Eubacteriales bacterium]
GMSDTFDQAVRRMGEVLAITGKVLPVTNQDVHLKAIFENGETVLGESKIAQRKKENNSRIQDVQLIPAHPRALEESLVAIAQADMIIMAPGSLYTSIIPNFLVDGVTEAVAKSRALKMMVLNIMTQDGETEGYTGVDHLEALWRHSGKNIVDVCIANNSPIPEEMQVQYAQEGAGPIWLSKEEGAAYNVKVHQYPLLAEGIQARHDSLALARAIFEVYDRARGVW